MIAHEVTNDGLDRDQLSKMGKQARKAMRVEYLTAIAERGYFKSEEILACHKAGIVPLVPKSTTSGAKFNGRFDKADFVYDRENDEYLSPAGERLIWPYTIGQHQCPILGTLALAPHDRAVNRPGDRVTPGGEPWRRTHLT